MKVAVMRFVSRTAGVIATTAILVCWAASSPTYAAGLPDKTDVATTRALPIDGDWLITSINKRIRFDRGRAYVLDPWMHMLFFKVETDKVIMQNLQRTGAGRYSADNLLLQGPANLTLAPDGNLDVSVQGALGPSRYLLKQTEVRNPQALSTELAAMRGDTGSTPLATQMKPTSVEPSPASPASPPATTGTEPRKQPLGVPAAKPAPYAPQPPEPPPADCKPIGKDPDTGLIICA